MSYALNSQCAIRLVPIILYILLLSMLNNHQDNAYKLTALLKYIGLSGYSLEKVSVLLEYFVILCLNNEKYNVVFCKHALGKQDISTITYR